MLPKISYPELGFELLIPMAADLLPILRSLVFKFLKSAIIFAFLAIILFK
jgi:hypothetical protein